MDVLNITALNYVSYLTLEIFQGGDIPEILLRNGNQMSSKV